MDSYQVTQIFFFILSWYQVSFRLVMKDWCLEWARLESVFKAVEVPGVLYAQGKGIPAGSGGFKMDSVI